jgi:hypothetical protein
MVVSAFRWALFGQVHSLTGLGGPALNARALEERPAAFNLLVEGHYRYHPFYGNTLVTGAGTYGLPDDAELLDCSLERNVPFTSRLTNSDGQLATRQ